MCNDKKNDPQKILNKANHIRISVELEYKPIKLRYETKLKCNAIRETKGVEHKKKRNEPNQPIAPIDGRTIS